MLTVKTVKLVSECLSVSNSNKSVIVIRIVMISKIRIIGNDLKSSYKSKQWVAVSSSGVNVSNDRCGSKSSS